MTIQFRADGTPKKRFQVMQHIVNGGMRKDIFIDGELLDWSVDTESLREAMKMGPKFFRSVQQDIEKHFVESVSDFVGKKLTPTDIKEAIKTGWI